MANEISATFSSGRTLYFLVFNNISQIWSTVSSAFAAYVAGNYTDYDVSMSELGTGIYTGNFPTAITAGVYSIVCREQLGGSPAATDPTVATGDYQWTGTVTFPLSNLATSGQVGELAPIRMSRGVAVSGFPFHMVSSADHVTDFTSGVYSGQIARDGGSFGALQSGTITEIGLGCAKCNLTSGDLLATTVALRFSATGISGGAADSVNFGLVLQRTSGQT